MKKINLLIAITALIFASCDKDEVDGQSNTFETTAVMAIIESGDNSASRGVNRPGSVLDFINTIEITADHEGTIGAPYSVSETYEMIDDGTGETNFILEDVALGMNKFTAYAESYEQDAASEFVWVTDGADLPWEWVDAQRLRHPNVNFYDNDNDPQLIKENPAAGENVVSFDMQAESGRLIVAVRLSEDIRTKFFSNFVYVQHKLVYANGTEDAWSPMAQFNNAHKDDLLTLYFSDNDKSIDGACVKFKFTVCDAISGATNRFTEELCIENGKSIGCVFEVTGDAVVEDITNFNFNFDWEEIDCHPCPSNDYVTSVPRYAYIQDEMLELCGMPVGSFHDITNLNLVNGGGNWHEEPIFNLDGTVSNVALVVSGTDRTNPTPVVWNATNGGAGSLIVPAGKVYLIVLPENDALNSLSVDNSARTPRSTGAIVGCN